MSTPAGEKGGSTVTTATDSYSTVVRQQARIFRRRLGATTDSDEQKSLWSAWSAAMHLLKRLRRQGRM